MVTTINKSTTKEEFQRQLHEATKRIQKNNNKGKLRALKQVFGKVKWPKDPLTIQKEMRNERK